MFGAFGLSGAFGELAGFAVLAALVAVTVVAAELTVVAVALLVCIVSIVTTRLGIISPHPGGGFPAKNFVPESFFYLENQSLTVAVSEQSSQPMIRQK